MDSIREQIIYQDKINDIIIVALRKNNILKVIVTAHLAEKLNIPIKEKTKELIRTRALAWHIMNEQDIDIFAQIIKLEYFNQKTELDFLKNAIKDIHYHWGRIDLNIDKKSLPEILNLILVNLPKQKFDIIFRTLLMITKKLSCQPEIKNEIIDFRKRLLQHIIDSGDIVGYYFLTNMHMPEIIFHNNQVLELLDNNYL